MKFLVDACVSSGILISFLRVEGHDVRSAVEIATSVSDQELLELALAEDRVLITADKDFGELMFVQNRAHGPVVRLVELTRRTGQRAARGLSAILARTERSGNPDRISG